MEEKQLRLAEETFGEVLRLSRMVQSGMQAQEKQSGLSGAQLWALWQLAQTPDIRVSELAEALFMHLSTASNLLDKLEKRGLVSRQRGEVDSRVVFLRLTPAGKQAVAASPAPARSHLRSSLLNLPPARLADLRAGILALLEQMENSSRAETG